MQQNEGDKHDIQHAGELLLKFQTYQKSNLLTDVTIVCGSYRISAHRLVLAAASDYFAAMFTRNVVEANQAEINLVDMDEEALAMLIDYCYTGKIDLKEDNVENILATARQIQLPAVVEWSCNFLKKQLHPSNCIGIQLFADTHGCSELHAAATAYTAEHFLEVVDNQEYLMLPAKEVGLLLASDDINVPSEQDAFQALLKWLMHSPGERKASLPKLLHHIKLPLLTPEFLTDHVESNTLLQENRHCSDLVIEAMKYHLLPERRSSLQSERTRPRKSTVGCLYAVGGTHESKGSKGCTTMERYCYRANQWIPAEFMPARRLQFGVAIVQGKLYIVGGRDGLKTLNTVECYDPVARVWTSLPPMATHRHGLGVGVLGDPLYAVGGHDGWSYLNTVERWDPSARQWSYVAPMSTQRSTVGVATLNGKLYAVGGRDGGACLRTVECFDPHTNKWSSVASMCRRRGGVGVGVLGGYLYAVGGHDAPASNPSSSRFDSVERYDPQTDCWMLVASLSVGRDSLGVCRLGHLLFAVGGYDGQSYLNIVEAYDPAANEWTKMGSLDFGRAGACVVALKKPS